MSGPPTAAVALAVLLLLAGCSVGYQPFPDADSSADATDTPGAAGPSGPPAGDHLGYYDGYWYNETLDVDASDGLTVAEREAVFARAMARIQLLRGLEFEEDVDIELVTRETFREEYAHHTAPESPDGVRTLDNAQHEALFLVPADEDVVAVREANRGDLVLGFYLPGEDRLVLVSEREPPTLPNERTLAHELVHALQDQRFDLSGLEGETLDEANAQRGLVEGSAGLVEQEYQRNCETGDWDCVGVRESDDRPMPGENFHFGVYFVGFFPYAEGPGFVEHHRDRDGWSAVDAMYDDPPTASAQVIYPATYGTDAYGTATVEDRNDGAWERVRSSRGDHASVGQSGLASMFAYTAYADRGRAGVVALEAFENVGEDGRLDARRPFTYDLPYAEGWYGDRLHAYENGGETAVVWNVTFQDGANATEFREGYERVVEFWGGEREASGEGNAAVWTLDGENSTFDGAVWVERDGASVIVVKAPSVDDLGDVYGPAG